MNPILGTIDGWLVEPGDFIVITDNERVVHEVEVRTVFGDTVHVYSHTTGDDFDFDIDLNGVYEVWGE